MDNILDKKINLSGLSDEEKRKIDRVEKFKKIGLILFIIVKHIVALIIYLFMIYLFVRFTHTNIAYSIFGILFWGIPTFFFIKLIFWVVGKLRGK